MKFLFVKAATPLSCKALILMNRPHLPCDNLLIHPVPNPCEGHQCSHLCLIGEGVKPVCHCPHMYKLAEDNRTCTSERQACSNHSLMYRSPEPLQSSLLDSFFPHMFMSPYFLTEYYMEKLLLSSSVLCGSA